MTASGVKPATAMSSTAIPVEPQARSASTSTSPKKPAHANPSEPEQPVNQQQQQQQHAPHPPHRQQQHQQVRTPAVTRPTAIGDGEAGDVVGDYVLGETIGKGTFGKVKVGLHIGTSEKVAVKILEKKRIVQIADVERVAREIKILKRNRHVNVIQLYEVIDSPERIYLIMEHVDGGEMFEYIVSHQRVREPDAVLFFQQIVDGLAYLHANNVTHRDLKPENLLLTHSPAGTSNSNNSSHARVVKIVDFGLSNTHDNNRLLRTACGSPCYAAPEMIEGKMYRGPVADLWSLGVVLFAMVCGYLPFEDSNTNMLYKKILSADYKLPPFLSHAVQDLIRKLLETNPEKRITVELIRQHPWFTSMRAVIPKLLAERDDSVVKARVLDQLAALGLDEHVVLEALQKGAHNNVTASYYLLYSKLVRSMKSSGGSGSKSTGSSSSVSAAVASPRGGNAQAQAQQQQQQHVRPSAPAVAASASSTPSPPAKTVASVGAIATAVGSSDNVRAVTPASALAQARRPSGQASATISSSSKDNAVRAGAPAAAATPRHTQQQPVASTSSHPAPQRPSSVRSGRTLVLLTNNSGAHQPVGYSSSSGHAYAPASGLSGVVPMPPRDRRPTGSATAKHPSSSVLAGGTGAIVLPSSRVSVSNGMVALAPLTHYPSQQRGEHSSNNSGGAPSSRSTARRHTGDHSIVASPRAVGIAASAAAATISSSTTAASAVVNATSESSQIVIARRRITQHPQGATSVSASQTPTVKSIAKLPPTASGSSSTLIPTTTTVTSGTAQLGLKEDDARSPAQASASNLRIHAPRPPSGSSSARPVVAAAAAHLTAVL